MTESTMTDMTAAVLRTEITVSAPLALWAAMTSQELAWLLTAGGMAVAAATLHRHRC